MTGTYRRNFDGDYRCTEFEVKRMLSDQSDISQDERVLKGYTMDDINLESLEKYRNRFSVLKPVHPWVDLNNREFLSRIGGWSWDRENNIEGLTLAGLLMFGNEWVITREVPEYFLDYREMSDNLMMTRWDDRVTSQDGTWSGNIFDFYFRVINRLTADIDVPFKLKDLIREEDTSVHKAIREALANALIHADYYGPQGIVIEKQSECFKFSNPGRLRVPVQQAIKGGVSDPRNKNLFKMFVLLGVGERAGSGIENIYKVWNEQSWRKPEITESLQPDRTTMVLRTTSLLPEKSIAFLRRALGQDYEHLSRQEVIALVAVHQENQVTNTRLQVLVNRNSVEINRILSGLVSKGILNPEGIGRGTRYLWSDSIRTDSNGVNSVTNGANSVTNGANSVTNGVNSVTNGVNSVTNGVNSLDNSEELSVKLRDIADGARGKKRLSMEKMNNIIMELCKIKPLSLKELSELLDRNSDGLRNNNLSQLIKGGRLSLLYPGHVNHPKQAYTAHTDDRTLS